MLQRNFRETLQFQRATRGVFPHALATVTFDQALDGVEQIRPHRLRTEISAPDASAHGIHEEQRNGREDQQSGEVVNLLRPQLDKKEIEAAVGKIDQHRLTGRTQAAIPPHKR